VLSFVQVGVLTGPLMYSGLLGLTSSDGLGFIVCSIPAQLVGINLLRQSTSAKF
jgi:hypothetical protein